MDDRQKNNPSLIPTVKAPNVPTKELAREWEERLRATSPNRYWSEEDIQQDPYKAILSHVGPRSKG